MKYVATITCFSYIVTIASATMPPSFNTFRRVLQVSVSCIENGVQCITNDTDEETTNWDTCSIQCCSDCYNTSTGQCIACVESESAAADGVGIAMTALFVVALLAIATAAVVYHKRNKKAAKAQLDSQIESTFNHSPYQSQVDKKIQLVTPAPSTPPQSEILSESEKSSLPHWRNTVSLSALGSEVDLTMSESPNDSEASRGTLMVVNLSQLGSEFEAISEFNANL